jgi:Putative auto-transporter adhesin, head GIN domain
MGSRSRAARWFAGGPGCLLSFACHGHGASEGQGLAGSGVVKTEERPVGAFSELHVSGVIRATLSESATPHVTLRGDDNLLAHVLVRQQGASLSLTQDQTLKPALILSADIAGPPLTLIVVGGAARVVAKGIHADKLTLSVAGAGQFEGAGSADQVTVIGALAARIDLSGLAARRVDVRLEKAAHLKLGYVEELTADVRGVARVEYTGDPKLETHLSEFGAVVKVP